MRKSRLSSTLMALATVELIGLSAEMSSVQDVETRGERFDNEAFGEVAPHYRLTRRTVTAPLVGSIVIA